MLLSDLGKPSIRRTVPEHLPFFFFLVNKENLSLQT